MRVKVKKKVNSPDRGNKRSDVELRQALIIAIQKRYIDKSGKIVFGYRQAEEESGIPRQTIHDYAGRHPKVANQLLNEIAEAETLVENELVSVIAENILLAAKEINRKLRKETETLKVFDLNGIIQTGVHNSRLIQEKSTSNTRLDLNLTEQTVMALYEIEKKARLLAGAAK